MALTLSGLLIAGGTVLLGQLGNAQSDRFGDTSSSSQPRCSNRTLRGNYAFNIDGTIVAGTNRLLLRGLAMTQFDGRGNLSQVDFTTINVRRSEQIGDPARALTSSIRTAPGRWRSSRVTGVRHFTSCSLSPIMAERSTT